MFTTVLDFIKTITDAYSIYCYQGKFYSLFSAEEMFTEEDEAEIGDIEIMNCDLLSFFDKEIEEIRIAKNSKNVVIYFVKITED